MPLSYSTIEAPHEIQKGYANTNAVVSTSVGDKGLGARRTTDVRNELYTLKLLEEHVGAPREEALPDSRYYKTGIVLDQGPTPSCVGHCWRQWGSSAPIMDSRGPSAMEWYYMAQAEDEYNDTPPEGGSSTLGGVKVAQKVGRCTSYVWLQDVDEIKRFILSGKGGVCCGTLWFSGMSNPDKWGLMVVPDDPANPQGGHEWFIYGYSRERDEFHMRNSWGHNWGLRGNGRLAASGMARLLEWYGDACGATDFRLPKQQAA